MADIGAVIDAGLVTRAVVCSVAAALVVLVPALRRGGPRWLLVAAATTAIYGAALPGMNAFHGAVFVFAVMVAGRTTGARDSRWSLSLAGIAVLSVLFLGVRHVGLDDWSFVVAGIAWRPLAIDMWMILRLVTFLWEFGATQDPPRLRSYALWSLFPFTIAGPLLRYVDFHAQLGAPATACAHRTRAWWVKVAGALARGAIGLGLAVLVHRVYGSRKLVLVPWVRMAFGFNAPAHAFYFTMSGYFALMEALGATWGVSLPRSFDKPFSRPNVSRFWATWNMTATSVFRDYLFYARWGMRRPNVYVNVIIVFVVVGVWHGLNLYWVLWGLLHGAAFCVYLVWRRVRGGERGTGRPIARAAATMLTYVFVCAAWAIPSRLLAR
jgi:D-alanyl-lipoteichoic acid acyltransferase DltB (MBOAT superfamily)